MKTQIDLKKLIKKGVISDEVEFERVLILYRKIRLLKAEHPEFSESIEQLRSMIKSYENLHWGNEDEITEQKIKESDDAEYIAEQERLFLQKRKEIIRKKLVEYGVNQQDLGVILGHTKSYTSELMNGIHPFNNKDLIIIHRLFDIKLEYLIPTIITQVERSKIKNSISKLQKPNFQSRLKFKKKDLAFLFF